jgi:hypothetical protein
MGALFRKAGIVDDPRLNRPLDFHGFASIGADHTEKGLITPASLRDQMVQGLVPCLDVDRIKPGRHGLNAFPIPRKNQSLAVQSQWNTPIRMANGLREQVGIRVKTHTTFGSFTHR